MAHAVLSPSSASRWLACTPSARLEQDFPDSSGEAAKEGTVAHELAENLLVTRLSLDMDDPAVVAAVERIAEIRLGGSPYYNPEMEDKVGEYVDYVLERYAEAKATTSDAEIALEEKIDLTAFVPESFGTRDCVIIADDKMIVIDLKYGKGVPVSAVENKQMMLYALGTYLQMCMVYDIQRVEMVIHQPRLDSVSTYELSIDNLLRWAENELKPRAALAFKGEGEFVVGKHCGFCRVKNRCRAYADHQLEIARYEFKDAVLLTDEEIADILTRTPSLTSWANGIADYAFNESVNNGRKWPGFKLVEGRSNRVLTDAEAAAKTLMQAGYDKSVIYKDPSLVSMTELEKLTGKKKFEVLLGDLISKPPGKPTLVTADDKRPEYVVKTAAEDDFADEVLNEAADDFSDMLGDEPSLVLSYYKLQTNHVNSKKWEAYEMLAEPVDIGIADYSFVIHDAHGQPPGYVQISEVSSGVIVTSPELSRASAIQAAKTNVIRNLTVMAEACKEGAERLAKLKVKARK